jgi:hypothetical protein
MIELFGILAMGVCNLVYGLDVQLLQESYAITTCKKSYAITNLQNNL